MDRDDDGDYSDGFDKAPEIEAPNRSVNELPLELSIDHDQFQSYEQLADYHNDQKTSIEFRRSVREA